MHASWCRVHGAWRMLYDARCIMILSICACVLLVRCLISLRYMWYQLEINLVSIGGRFGDHYGIMLAWLWGQSPFPKKMKHTECILSWFPNDDSDNFLEPMRVHSLDFPIIVLLYTHVHPVIWVSMWILCVSGCEFGNYLESMRTHCWGPFPITVL